MRLRIHLLFLYCIASTISFAQPPDTIRTVVIADPAFNPKIELSFLGGSAMCGQLFTNRRETPGFFSDSYEQTMQSFIKWSTGYQFGIEARCHFSKRISLLAGCDFMSHVIRYNAFLGHNFITTITDTFRIGYYRKQHQSWLDIPISVDVVVYDRVNHKLKCDAFVGISTSINCGRDLIALWRMRQFNSPASEESSYYPGELEPFSVLHFNSFSGFRVSYKLNQTLSIDLSPNFRYAFINFGDMEKQVSDYYLDIHPYYIGLNAGVTFQF